MHGPGSSPSRSSAGHVPRNVAALVDPPPQRASDVATALDPEEARAVLAAAAQVRNSARWSPSCTGTRPPSLGERMLAGSEWHDEDLVLAQPNGRPIDRTDYDDWTRLLAAAGVRHVRLHAAGTPPPRCSA